MITFDVNTNEVLNYFKNLNPQAKIRELLNSLAYTLIEERQRRILDKETSEGSPTPELSESTIALKREKGSSTPEHPLRETDYLLKNMEPVTVSDLVVMLGGDNRVMHEIRAALDPDYSPSTRKRPVRDFWSLGINDQQIINTQLQQFAEMF